MTTQEIKQLQDQLVRQGYMTQAEVNTGYGILGPKTTAALNAAERGDSPKYSTGGGTNTKTKEQLDAEYSAALSSDPRTQKYINAGNTADMIKYAMETGDISSLVNEYGQPFSSKDQQEALKKAEKDVQAFYAAQKEKETADAQASLAQKQADYQNYLLTSSQNFQDNKTTLDQNAANQGVLFSGGRVQKEQQLQNKYEQDQAYKLGNYTRDIRSLASDYQYKYGNDAANKLSKYYKLGGNTYNANVATGGVGSSSISSVYRPNKFNYTGTREAEKGVDINQRATRYLTNRANKLMSSGYSNSL